MSQFKKYIEIISEGNKTITPKQHSPGSVVGGGKLSHSITVSLGIIGNQIERGDFKEVNTKIKEQKQIVDQHLKWLEINDNNNKSAVSEYKKAFNNGLKSIEESFLNFLEKIKYKQ